MRSLRPEPRRGRTIVLALLVAVGLVLGGWHTRAVLAGPPDPTVLTVGGVSFRVTGAEEVTGLSDADLGGMSHGVNGLVTSDKALVRVVLTVTAGDVDTTYDATALRAIASGQPSGAAPLAGSLPLRGRLAAHAHLEGSLSYVLPRDGSHVVLGAGPGTPRVPLLYMSTAGGSPGDTHDSHVAPKPSQKE
ncbi:hypothetical protein ASE25_09345 [Terrabacter sp. Root85]|jgi:hypothetical protein|uniref:hypothetical protein n=1 Tax=unclassified Terrabacter TaxID=2630222 RepID=UPI00070069FE|nr:MULTISPECIES: hypothetical protein [unclassified Terrabacter]KRC89745.1 hypothetical protein ASE25_09345 [Terrabacter sp. Root85]KRF47733.1 hypothetical protein ASH01_21245 [Terrabacter sp. Soil811]